MRNFVYPRLFVLFNRRQIVTFHQYSLTCCWLTARAQC